MFEYYVRKITAYLQRSLSQSEIQIAMDKFTAGWHWMATAEYIK